MKTKAEIYKIINNCVDQLTKTSNNYEEMRILGGIETLLIALNILEAGKPFSYRKIEYFSFFKRKKERQETYRELILRLVNENLKK